MKLKAVYEKKDDIPEAFLELYTEKSGKWALTEVEGLQTQANVDAIKGALDKERDDHKATKAKLGKWNNLDPEIVIPQIDKIPELEALADSNKDVQGKIDAAVEARLKGATAPLQREIDTLKETNTTLSEEVTGFKTQETKRKIADSVREAATLAKCVPTAIDDIIFRAENIFEVDTSGKIITRDGVGVTPGLEAAIWLDDSKKTKPHWWPLSEGGGSGGSGGGGKFSENPFTKDNWNMTAQGKVVSEKGMDVAQQMAKAAGTTVGGPKPEK